MSMFDDNNDGPRFLHERNGLVGALAELDRLQRAARHPLSGDGMFEPHLAHPTAAVTNPLGYIANGGDDPYAEILAIGLDRSRDV